MLKRQAQRCRCQPAMLNGRRIGAPAFELFMGLARSRLDALQFGWIAQGVGMSFSSMNGAPSGDQGVCRLPSMRVIVGAPRGRTRPFFLFRMDGFVHFCPRAFSAFKQY